MVMTGKTPVLNVEGSGASSKEFFGRVTLLDEGQRTICIVRTCPVAETLGSQNVVQTSNSCRGPAQRKCDLMDEHDVFPTRRW